LASLIIIPHAMRLDAQSEKLLLLSPLQNPADSLIVSLSCKPKRNHESHPCLQKISMPIIASRAIHPASSSPHLPSIASASPDHEPLTRNPSFERLKAAATLAF
jgi:hypothetical protein